MSRRARGEGSVYRLANGSWRGEVKATLPTGQKVRRQARGRTKAEVVERLRVIRAELELGVVTSDAKLAHYLDVWLLSCARRGLKPGTVTGYADMARLHIVPALGKKPLCKLSVGELDEWLAALDAKGLAYNSRLQALAVLRSALADAVRQGLIVRSPGAIARPPRRHESDVEPAAYTTAEARAVVRAAETPDEKARAVVGMILGLRQGEALGLRWPEVDFEAETVSVIAARTRVRWEHGPVCAKPSAHSAASCPARVEAAPLGTPKSLQGRRVLYPPREVMDVLREHRASQNELRLRLGSAWVGDHVFPGQWGGPADRSADSRRWAAPCAAVPVSPLSALTPADAHQ